MYTVQYVHVETMDTSKNVYCTNMYMYNMYVRMQLLLSNSYMYFLQQINSLKFSELIYISTFDQYILN